MGNEMLTRCRHFARGLRCVLGPDVSLKPRPVVLHRAGLLAVLALLLAALPAASETFDGRRAVIIDGDTIALGSERVRILNIDAPESFRSHCERELRAGLKAKERLAALVRSGAIEVERHGQDRYRRTLARITVSGRDVGEVLVREGLALPWRDGAEAKEERTRHWCG